MTDMHLTQLKITVEQGQYEIDEVLVAEALMIRCLGSERSRGRDAHSRAADEIPHPGWSGPESHL